jgi:hypothetical protein
MNAIRNVGLFLGLLALFIGLSGSLGAMASDQPPSSTPEVQQQIQRLAGELVNLAENPQHSPAAYRAVREQARAAGLLNEVVARASDIKSLMKSLMMVKKDLENPAKTSLLQNPAYQQLLRQSWAQDLDQLRQLDPARAKALEAMGPQVSLEEREGKGQLK